MCRPVQLSPAIPRASFPEIRMSGNFDIAIVGGGFSGLAVLANVVKAAAHPLSIAIISRDAPDVFGPAYSTTRPEHLLNVRAQAMGLFADHHRGFLEWAAERDAGAAPDDYLPRCLYAEYLKSVLAETRALALQKSVALHFIKADVTDLVDEQDLIKVATSAGDITTRSAVLAVGNALKAPADKGQDGRLVSNPWAHDFNAPAAGSFRRIALIGSGLTALDTIVSILKAGWDGEITCFSGSGLLPMAHPVQYDAAKIFSFPREEVTAKPLSRLLHLLRGETERVEWQYVVDSLRPHLQDIWRSLTPRDRLRLAEKYFTLWNVHRHRCAPQIRAQADAAIAAGQLRMVRARCSGAGADAQGVTLDLRHAGGTEAAARFDIAFRCTGVNYAVANNPLLSRLLKSGILESAGNPYGVRADADFRAYAGPGGDVYVIGTPLFGQLFETTAVPELREQAAVAAAALLDRDAAGQSLPRKGGLLRGQ
jgi:uncharacterized NAD(P)/FAD-binding protein YdhS